MKQGFIKCHPYLPSTPQISCVFIFYDQSSLGFICKAKSLWTHIFSFAQAMLVSLLSQLHLRFSKTLVSPMIMQSKFDLPSHARTWVMKCSGKKLKDWKADIKKNYYKNHLSFDQQKHYKDKGVYADQWEHLIKYWAIEEVKAQSDKNKESRAERKYNHTTRTKSFPRVRKEQNKLGHSPTRAHMFKVRYTKDTGIAEATKAMIDEMNERTTLNANLSNDGPNDTFGQVMGKEKHGRVRMYGLGVSPSNLWTNTSGHKANQDITMDAMEAENSELRSKVSHVQHVPNNLANTSNQVITASSPLDMAARHQAWSLSSIQDASLTQVGDIVVLKSIIRPTETVAIGVLKSTDASKEVEGEELGPDYWEIHVQGPTKPNGSLIRSYGLVKTVGQAIGAHVAWPAPFVISQLMDPSGEYLYK